MSEAEETSVTDENTSWNYTDRENLFRKKPHSILSKKDRKKKPNERPGTKHNIIENNFSPNWFDAQETNPASVINSEQRTVSNVTSETAEPSTDRNPTISDIQEDSSSFGCDCFGEMFRYLKRKLFKKRTSTPQSKRVKLDNETSESDVVSSTNHLPNVINSRTEVVVAEQTEVVVRDICPESVAEQFNETQNGLQCEKRNKKKRRKSKSSNASAENIKRMPEEIRNNPKLIKYYFNRYSLFSKYDDGIKLDAESWYSVTPEKISIEIARRCQCDVIIDAFCGAGGNTVQFAFVCERVIAIDIDAEKIKLAKHNAEIYGVADRIEFIVGDFFELAPSLTADVVFLSPPWGGPSYNVVRDLPLDQIMEPYGGKHLYQVAKQISDLIAYFLPRNILVTEVAALEPGEYVKIDRNYLDNRLVAITAYFGDLVEDYGDEWNN